MWNTVYTLLISFVIITRSLIKCIFYSWLIINFTYLFKITKPKLFIIHIFRVIFHFIHFFTWNMHYFYKQMERFISFLKSFFICSVKTVPTASIQKKHVKNSSLRRKMKTQSEKPEGIIKYSDAASFVSPNTVISLSLYDLHALALTNEPALRSFDRRADRHNTYTPLSVSMILSDDVFLLNIL